MTISDANAVPDGADIRADVCIAGAGAAGITLARALTGTGRTVALLESGGYESDATVQELYRGESVGEPYEVEWTRLRQFGGTTNHWGGWCRPFDPEDFAERQWLGHSGWPFGRDTLDGYYELARAVCAVSEGPFDARELFGDARYGAAPLVESRAVTTWVYR